MRKIVFTVITVALFHKFQAQTAEQLNPIKWGFNIGSTLTNASVIKSDQSAYKSINVSNSAGFRIGILLEMNITEHFSFSPKAELSLLQFVS